MPEIAVVVVNWNGAHLLRTCLGSLRRQTFADFETILVDNGSTDDSLELVAREFPEVRVLPLTENLGLAGGTNAGIGITDAPIIATLNNDTEADPRWLAELHAALEAHPEAGSAASKLLLFDRRDVDPLGRRLLRPGRHPGESRRLAARQRQRTAARS